ncbi:MAG: hypothetical protein AAGF88_08840 [Pseudomonadota bacterium]
MIRALPLVLLALPVHAEPWACTFTAECVAGEDCAATHWDAEVIAADHEGQLFLSSVSGDTAVTRLGDDAYAAPDTLLSISANGTATLSTHLEIALTYFGTCEVLE